MAGAGGLFLMMIGAALGAVSGLIALGLPSFASLVRLGAVAARRIAVTGAALAVVSIVTTLPFWIAFVTGKGSRGEDFQRAEVDLWIYAVLLVPFVTLAVVTSRLRKGSST
jgi:hypothetical protein